MKEILLKSVKADILGRSSPTNRSPIAQEALYLGGFAGNPGPQLQLPTQVTVPDAAQSIRFAVKGDIDGLKDLFSQRLASPRDKSISRGFSLVRVGSTTPSPPNLIF